jgi:response regulator RpfG family c-di-GMP phosphodiesterase
MERVVLIVDDEESIANLLSQQLKELGWICHSAHTGEEALEIFRSRDIQVVISDLSLQGESGIELLAECRKLKPDVVRIAFSGYADFDRTVSAINEGHILRFLQKHWTMETLHQVMEYGWEYYGLRAERKQLTESLKVMNASLERKRWELEEKNKRLNELNSDLEARVIEKNRSLYIHSTLADWLLGEHSLAETLEKFQELLTTHLPLRSLAVMAVLPPGSEVANGSIVPDMVLEAVEDDPSPGGGGAGRGS